MQESGKFLPLFMLDNRQNLALKEYDSRMGASGFENTTSIDEFSGVFNTWIRFLIMQISAEIGNFALFDGC